MIEVKDEILEGEPLYNIVDKNNQTIYGDVKISMETSIIQKGTPINKELFESIKSGNDLVATYNKGANSFDNNYNYLKLNNKIVRYEVGQRVFIDTNFQASNFNTSIIPAFSSLEPVNGFSIEGSIGYSEDFWKAFDNDRTTRGGLGVSASSATSKINFPFPIKPKKIYVKTEGVAAWSISGIGSVEATTEKTFELANSDFITSVTFTRAAGAGGGIYSYEIIEGEAYMFNPQLYTYININNLGNILIDTPLALNKKYELTYDGTVFNAKEVV